jgi:hypothetical protein
MNKPHMMSPEPPKPHTDSVPGGPGTQDQPSPRGNPEVKPQQPNTPPK